ncbi:MAG: arginine--tRNA ligase, partial [Pseudobutyrivibrio sp.]|nr:arginine--tRNA ligase [Pseudobutyrivibrio sp.]
MKEILQQIKEEVVKGFTEAGYDEKYAMVTLSNRPDLCQFQCNGAMAAAKEYKKAPIAIANEVVEKLVANAMFSKCEACPPGFINMNLSDEFIAGFVSGMAADTERFGVDKVATPKKVMIDYG